MTYKFDKWIPGNWNSFIKFMLSKEMFEDADINKWEYYMTIWQMQERDKDGR